MELRDELLKSFMKTHILILILAFLSCYTLEANAYNRRQISNKDGLSNGSILSLGQNDNHLMLFGSCDGLNIYDGKSIQVYRPTTAQDKNRLSGNIIERIISTKPGISWIKTNYGLNKLDLDKEEVTTFPQFTSRVILFTNHKKDLFVYTRHKKLYRYDEATDSFCELPIRNCSRLPGEDMLDVKFDAENRLWMYSRRDESLCFVFNDTENPSMDFCRSNPFPATIKKAFSDGADEYIVDDEYNLQVIDSTHTRKTWITNLRHLMQRKDEIKAIVRNKDDFFIGFQTTGAVRIAPTPGKNGGYTVEDLGLHCGVLCMMRDKAQDIVWMGTDGEGVYMYTEEAYTLKSFLTSDVCPRASKPIRAIYKDHYNTLWIGTRGSGIACFPDFMPERPSEPLYYKVTNSALKENSVYAFAPSSRNILWIGSDGGLNYYSYLRKEIAKVDTPPHYPPVNFVHALCEINDSTLWIASGGTGVLEVKLSGDVDHPEIREVRQFLYRKKLFAYNYFFSLFEDKADGSLLFGNRGYGVFTYRPGKDSLSTLYYDPAPDNQATNEIFSITKDKAGNIWLGTSYGLVKHSAEGKTYLLNELNKFINSTVHSIQVDETGCLWLGTNKGMVRFDPDNEIYQLYNQTNGLEVIEFCDGVSYADATNQSLYFGGTNGFVTIRKKEYATERIQFPITYTNFRLLGQAANLADYTTQTHRGKTLVLNHRQHTFSLNLSVVDYIYGNNIFFYHRIKESGKAWITTSRTLSFTNLHPGEYTLETKYINKATNAESPIHYMLIHITPPWYQTTLAYCLYGVLAVVVFCLAVLFFIRRGRFKKQQELKELEQAHQKEVYESKLGFFANIAYEFSTPLTLIFGPCRHIIDSCTDKNSIKYAKVIQHNAEILNDLTQEIITFRNIESKNRKPRIETLSVGEILSKDLVAFVDRAHSSRIVFEKEIDSKLVWNTDSFFLRTIVINLLSNAFCHTCEQGKVSIRANASESCLSIAIAYTGEIRESDLRIVTDTYHVLQSFEDTTDISHSRNQLGLALSHNMIRLLQGELYITPEGHCVCFTVTLPPLEPHPQAMKIFDTAPVKPVYLEKRSELELKEDSLEFHISRQTLFLIEHDKEMLWYLIDIFRKDFNIIPIEDYTKVMKKLEDAQPHLIICDITSNMENSLVLTKQIKTNKNYAHIPLILLSGERNMDEQIKGINAGAEMYISKPFHSDLLKTSVHQILSRKETLKSYFHSPRSAYELSNAKLVHKEDKKFIKEVLDIIYAELTNKDLSAAFIAEKLNMSVRHLYRKLNEIGETQPPADLIKECRLQVARDLLIHSKYSIDEIVYKSGFQARSTFFKCFTEKYQCTPKEFRNRQG